MAKLEPKFTAPAFGRWLAERRGKRSQEMIARRLREAIPDAHLRPSLNRSSVHNYEQGRVPNWLILRAYSKIFGITYENITTQLAKSVIVESPNSRTGGQKSATVDDLQTGSDEKSPDLRTSDDGVTVAIHDGRSEPTGGGDQAVQEQAPLTLDAILDQIDSLSLRRLATAVSHAIGRAARSDRSIPKPHRQGPARSRRHDRDDSRHAR